ncbi:MAG TPA: deiodinase-like protein [Phycisphaerae bacterium]|nr:deiodinase-like protein [Phycisphaerae bacterium]
MYPILLLVGIFFFLTSSRLWADFPSGPSPKAIAPTVIVTPTWKIGAIAPRLNIVDLQFHGIDPDQFRGKPLLVEFGSLTEPAFRLSSSNVEFMAHRWANQVNFLVVYQRESHPAGSSQELDINKTDGFDLSAPADESQRIAYASEAQSKLNLNNVTLAVDAWDNYSSHSYGGLPNMTFLIDANGRMVAAWPWMIPWQVNEAIGDLVANRPIAVADLGPPFAPDTSPPLEFDAGIFDPQGAFRALASALDNAGVSPDQLKAILPSLTDLHMAILDFQGKAAKLRQNQQQFSNSYPQDRMDQIADLRGKANAFRDALQENLNSDQYQQVMTAINHTRIGRLFDPNAD